MKYFFKVKYGYREEEVLRIDETQLATAMKAQAYGGVLVTQDGTISGRQIIAILPDWEECLYQINKEIRGMPLENVPSKVRAEYYEMIKGASNRLGQISTKPVELTGPGN